MRVISEEILIDYILDNPNIFKCIDVYFSLSCYDTGLLAFINKSPLLTTDKEYDFKGLLAYGLINTAYIGEHIFYVLNEKGYAALLINNEAKKLDVDHDNLASFIKGAVNYLKDSRSLVSLADFKMYTMFLKVKDFPSALIPKLMLMNNNSYPKLYDGEYDLLNKLNIIHEDKVFDETGNIVPVLKLTSLGKDFVNFCKNGIKYYE